MTTYVVEEKLKRDLAKTKKSLERFKKFYIDQHKENIRLQNCYDQESIKLNEVIKDRNIFRDDLINELKLQLNCSKTEYYSPTAIVGRIMNTISKAQAFHVNLK